ncbi:MAG: hypothetical protein FJ246_00715 [Nitrospira sp.]|nr:hypothetical protein [Nitrospira sp.]
MTEPPLTVFFADSMLGRLARWLRILGYDTAYERVVPDRDVIDRVLRENRWLLTRDEDLAKRRVLRGRHTLLTSDALEEQLRQLARELSLDLAIDPHRASRCAECNLTLGPIPHEEAVRLVPAFVSGQQAAFTSCAGCGRIYWPGTHWSDLLARLKRFRGPAPDSALVAGP